MSTITLPGFIDCDHGRGDQRGALRPWISAVETHDVASCMVSAISSGLLRLKSSAISLGVAAGGLAAWPPRPRPDEGGAEAT